MIVGMKSYEIALDNKIKLELGSLGENILLDFDPHDFAIDDEIYIGDSIIQITQICTVCSHLSVFGEELPNLLKSHRGLYCKILKSGIITKDMIVQIKG
jgi:MOSC domain-containing protein YiiM